MSDDLYSALFAAQGEFPDINKGKSNDFFKSKYADLHSIVAAIDPVLRKHGLSVLQALDNIDGAPALRTTIWHGESNSGYGFVTPLVLAKPDPQAAGSAITYFRRYAYLTILGLVPVDEDDDAEGSMEREQKSAGYEMGQGNDAFDAILRAEEFAEEGSFISSLASQIRTKGTLTPKQITSGLRAAQALLEQVE